MDLKRDLEVINLSSGRLLKEGIEDILTLHRLGLAEDFTRSFATINCIENLNSQLVKYLRKVHNFINLDQMQTTIKEEIKKRASNEEISTRNGT